MKIQTLKNNLLEAYSADNLNVISAILLNLYKKQQFSTLQKFAEMISEFVPVEIDEYGKGFSKLMMLYHPDRGNIHRTEIEKLAAENNFDALLQYSHILKLERIEEMATALESFDDIDYSPVYDWDLGSEGFTYVSEKQKSGAAEKEYFRKNKRISLYDAITIKYLGKTNKEFPSWYLEDMEELELSASDIGNLDGIQFCVHTRIFDLSDNYIVDVSPMENLRMVEELNLSNNRIGIIDALGNLQNLRVLDLSGNNITDIEPVFELNQLEYINLKGNKISREQITKLEELEVTVEI